MLIPINELRCSKDGTEFPKGYRLVYFNNNKYSVGEYSSDIENFMYGFCDSYPIMDYDDIPEFISVEDILDRCLKQCEDVDKVVMYTTDGDIVMEKSRSDL